ncbi:uncharacterized protein G2W53_032710 [Senna tora]|uniref:Uncharacterized protein n=1 Tax=Senna tora TaxID=362788 RepID=A0A834SX76_9FABA|nr:uncharacterized protein G2W53_032710 [Senna tora]
MGGRKMGSMEEGGCWRLDMKAKGGGGLKDREDAGDVEVGVKMVYE